MLKGSNKKYHISNKFSKIGFVKIMGQIKEKLNEHAS